MHYYEVAPTKIIRAGSSTFTYSSDTPLHIGQIVQIEIGRQSLIGVVMKNAPKPTYPTKAIQTVLTSLILPPELIATTLWIAEYYATPLATVLQTVLPRGLTKTRRPAKPATKPIVTRTIDRTLTTDQAAAIQALDAQHSGTALLHGITGSGKTAVYIDQAKKTVAAGTSVIVLVPEIALTSQLVDEFRQHFDDVVLTHSRQTESQRHLAWQACLETKRPTVVIGPRSALFMPLTNIGLIIVDEMHEPSFKQEQSPRYSTLRVASVLARHHGAKLILGSATPPISEYFTAKQSARPIIEMSHLARADAVKPTVKLVDMTKRTHFSRHRFLSNDLLNQLEATFASGNQALIFHNRRGSASMTLCENCGWSAGCPRCFVPLTLHSDQHLLRCHICNHTEKVPTSCPVCHSTDVFHKGIGTKLIESELRKLFPKQTIMRFDGDSETTETVDQKYGELYDGTIDLIIGTQVIAKGLDLPKLRTVGVVQADAGLSLPDYSSAERTFQLLAQVVGRVGRSSHATTVIVQSYQPTHPSVALGLSQNYTEFYTHALTERRRATFPPFCFLLKLTCSYKTEAAAIKNAQQLARKLKTEIPSSVEILGPTPSFYERQRDSYRWQLTLKSAKRADLVAALQHVPPAHWQFELDPTSLL